VNPHPVAFGFVGRGFTKKIRMSPKIKCLKLTVIKVTFEITYLTVVNLSTPHNTLNSGFNNCLDLKNYDVSGVCAFVLDNLQVGAPARSNCGGLGLKNIILQE
jgi:hypothetical protein